MVLLLKQISTQDYKTDVLFIISDDIDSDINRRINKDYFTSPAAYMCRIGCTVSLNLNTRVFCTEIFSLSDISISAIKKNKNLYSKK